MHREHQPLRTLRGLLLVVGALAVAVAVPAGADTESEHSDGGQEAAELWRSPHDVIVTIPADEPEEAAEETAERLAGYGEVVDLDLTDREGNRLLGVRTPPAAPVAAEQLAADEAVAAVEHAPVHRVQRPSDHVDLNDPRLDEQWGLVEHEIVDLWDRGGVELDDPPIIAVLDTGVDATLGLPGTRILPGWDVIMNQPHYGDVAADPHGTLVAKVAAAEADDGYGTAGVCPSCEILPFIVIDDLSFMDDPAVTALDIAIGIDFAVEDGAEVINISLGSPLADPYTDAAAREAVDDGVAVVASAGNEGISARNYPAGYPEVVAVGGLAESGAAHWATNYGDWVATAAPFTHPVGQYGTADGTSFSAPMVSGAIALGVGLDDSVEPLDMVEAIAETGADHDAFAGTLRADAAFEAARGEDAGGQPGDSDEGAEEVSTVRLAGADRVLTAAEIAETEWDRDTDVAVVATATDFPDALTAGAALRGEGPVLLATDEAPVATTEVLEALAVDEVLIAGGEAAVPVPVEEELAARHRVTRVAGGDRVGTAAQLALERFSEASEAVVVDAQSQGQALEGAAMAARRGVPALLALSDELPSITSEALDELEASSVVLYGEFDETVEDALADEFEVTLADPDLPPAAAEEALVARADDLADALAGTALAGAREAALVRLDRDGLTDQQQEHLATVSPTQLTVLGGDVALPDEIIEDAVDAAQDDSSEPER